MLKRFGLGFLVLFVLCLLGSRPASADTSVSNVSDGFGGSFSLSVTNCGASGCTVTLTIDTSSLNNPSTDAFIDAVDWKLGNGSTTGTLAQAPNGTSAWNTPTTTSLNSGSSPCTGSNGDVQTCTAASTAPGAATGGTLTWKWTGVTATDTNISHVGYQYNGGTWTLDKNGNPRYTGQIVSCGFTSNGTADCGGGSSPPTVSEPGSMALMGFGLVGLVGILRRRTKTRA